MNERIVDMSDQDERNQFVRSLEKLRGRYRFEVKRYRPRRTDRQNRYYWPCVVHPFGEFLREQGEMFTDDQAHEMLKHKFLQVEVVSPATGERLTCTRRTPDLDTAEFNEYVERCAHWLNEMFGIIVPEPQ